MTVFSTILNWYLAVKQSHLGSSFELQLFQEWTQNIPGHRHVSLYHNNALSADQGLMSTLDTAETHLAATRCCCNLSWYLVVFLLNASSNSDRWNSYWSARLRVAGARHFRFGLARYSSGWGCIIHFYDHWNGDSQSQLPMDISVLLRIFIRWGDMVTEVLISVFHSYQPYQGKYIAKRVDSIQSQPIPAKIIKYC